MMDDAALPSKDQLLAMAIAANPDFARLMAERARLEAQMAGLINPAGGGGGATPNNGRVFPVASPKELRAEQAEWTAKRDAVTQRIAALKADARYVAAREREEARAELAAKAVRLIAERKVMPKAKDPAPLDRPARPKTPDDYQSHFDATRPLDKAERLGRLPKMPTTEVFNRPKSGKKPAPDFRPLLSEAKRTAAANLDDRLTAARQAAKDKPTLSIDALADQIKSRKDKREPMFDLDRARRGPAKPKTKAADDLDTRRDRAQAAKKKRKSLLGRFE